MNESEIKKLLFKNLEIAQENNELLKKINKARIWGNVFWAIKWAFILALSFGAYLYIQPYIEKLTNLTGELSSGVININDVGESFGIFDKIKDLSN